FVASAPRSSAYRGSVLSLSLTRHTREGGDPLWLSSAKAGGARRCPRSQGEAFSAQAPGSLRRRGLRQCIKRRSSPTAAALPDPKAALTRGCSGRGRIAMWDHLERNTWLNHFSGR